MEERLLKKIIYKGRIKAITGLHIGGTNSGIDIGGVDKFVIRNPITKEPYIPGSSIKGKMRSLLELADGTIGPPAGRNVKFGPSENSEAKSVKLHGTAKKDSQRPSRLQVRDAKLAEEWRDPDIYNDSDMLFTEAKTEVVIDRITSAANPRTNERVPAGVEFDLEMVLNIFSSDDEEMLKEALLTSIKLIEDDYLGGNGSRGYGQVKIEITEVIERTPESYVELAREALNSLNN